MGQDCLLLHAKSSTIASRRHPLDADAPRQARTDEISAAGPQTWRSVVGRGEADRRDALAAGPRESYSADEEVFKYRYAFTQLIRNGITTAMPITSTYYRQWAETYDEMAAVAGVAAELGLRTYLGPCYMSGMSYWRADGNLAHHWDEARGLAGLDGAVRFFDDFDEFTQCVRTFGRTVKSLFVLSIRHSSLEH